MISNNDSLHDSGQNRGDGNETIISCGEWFEEDRTYVLWERRRQELRLLKTRNEDRRDQLRLSKFHHNIASY